MSIDPILDLLRASQQEQVSVKVLCHGAEIRGVVKEIGEYAVELDSRDTRSAVRLQSIDAVTILPHHEYNQGAL